MSELTKFLAEISADPGLRERFAKLSASDDALAVLAALAQECGTPISEEELRAAAKESDALSDAGLEQIAAGGSLPYSPPTFP